MRNRYLDEETEKVYKEYSAFLDAAGLPYNNNQNGFHVCLEMEHIKHSFTQVCRVHNGEIIDRNKSCHHTGKEIVTGLFKGF